MTSETIETAVRLEIMDDMRAREVADLLVRCSGVPLARVASALGFQNLALFSEWFEGCHGEHPEVARSGWSVFSTVAPAGPDSDGPDELLLQRVRRALALALERPGTTEMIRAMRSRGPISPDSRKR